MSSTFGRGSEFVVRLPVAVAEVSGHTVSKARTPSVAPVNLKRRVLVVDDNIDAAETLAELLQLCGHEVRVAHDGLSALQAASEYLPGVVLLDIGLPHMDGFEVAKQIRQQSALKGVVLVALTGYGQASDLKRSVEAGFDFHLTKPADFTQIEKILAGS